MKNYISIISLNKNGRGIWDLDVSKGCANGLLNDARGCYGDCYAARSANRRGFDFSKTVLRFFKSIKHERQIIEKINSVDMSFIRIGCSGDPSENWEHTFSILEKIKRCNKEIVIITKHWTVIHDRFLNKLKEYKVCINTSVSALDEPEQLSKCLAQYNRLKSYCKSILRIVSCDFNKENENGLRLSIIQDFLFKNESVIDTVFRPSKSNPLIADGVINISIKRFINSKQIVSKFNKKAYLGKCETCKDQCGIFNEKIRTIPSPVQHLLFNKN